MSVRDHPRKTAIVLVAIALIVMLLMRPHRFGEVNQLTYKVASALYSICNRQDTVRLDSIEQLIESGVKDSKLSAQEAGWLSGILELAQQGRWDKARGRARQLMQDQVHNP